MPLRNIMAAIRMVGCLVLLGLWATGCAVVSSGGDSESAAIVPSRLVVIVFPADQRPPYVSRNTTAIQTLWNWLEDVKTRQPSTSEVGPVEIPYEITFYESRSPYSRIMNRDRLVTFYESGKPPALDVKDISRLEETMRRFPSEWHDRDQ